VITGILNDVLLQYHVTGKLLGDTLFFGCKHQSQDFLYEDELTQYEKDEVLTKLFEHKTDTTFIKKTLNIKSL